MSLESEFLKLAHAKESAAELATTIAELELAVIAEMTKVGVTNVSVSDAIKGTVVAIKGTLVRVTRVVINDEQLETALGATMWNKVIKKVLDKDKLEAMIVVGKIDAAVVAAASEEKINKPFVKITGSTIGVIVIPNIAGVKARPRTVKVPVAKPKA